MDQNQNQPGAQNNSTTKQQVVDSIKKANNVLITVSQNPSIDQLASCIGLALVLNKLNKHATAIFSGSVPSTIEFLQPEKTLETNTDSLRDFIISLDRNKADKLRYKVEDNVVRIFITPYRTSLTQDDFVYSQGDFNVDLVIALGVDQREHLDLAIMQQGRILHDAVVVGVSAGAIQSGVGAINWHEPAASSISELVVSLSDSLQPGLFDEQISTALLTGIVSETDRFRNEKTTAKVMSVSAQLMSSGANQQLVTSQLEPKLSTIPESEKNVSQVPSLQSTQNTSFDIPKEGEDGPKEAAVPLHIDPNAPAPAVQLPGEESDEIKKINIDEAGIIHEDSAQTSQNDQMINKPHKVIQPLQPNQTSQTSSYIYEPPERGGTFTAEAQNDPTTEQPNPLAQNTLPTPLMSHGSPLNNDETQQPPANPEVIGSSEVDNNVASPVEASSVEQASSENGIDQDAARKAVLEAAAASSSDSLPSPIAALNAQPMDLSAPSTPQQAIDQLPPPPLPPPLTPMPEPPMPQNMSPQTSNTPPEQTASTTQQGNTPFNLPPP